MTYTQPAIQEFLAGISPFNQLSSDALAKLSEQFQPLRYHMGQAILVRDTMPAFVAILYEGQARLLGHNPQTKVLETVELLQPGAVLGWAGLIRGVSCETVLASTPALCLTLKAADFLTLLEHEPQLATTFHNNCALIEIFDLLGMELERRALGTGKLKELAFKACSEAVVLNLLPGKMPLKQLDPNLLWFVSGGARTNFAAGSCLSLALPKGIDSQTYVEVEGPGKARLVGLREPRGEFSTPHLVTASTDIPYALEHLESVIDNEQKQSAHYPHVYARGPVAATLACFQMLSQYLEIPLRRDVLHRALTHQFNSKTGISLQFCGAMAELMGLNSQLVNVPAKAVSRLQAPALLRWQDSFALLYKAGERELILAVPESGIRHLKPADFIELWGEKGQVLLLQPTQGTPKQRFGLSWFLPSLYRYRKVILEVFIASFFVQLLGLANPLITQVIIDKVLVQNSINTLHILGSFLVVVAIIEAVLGTLRTNLFADTTNRIDLDLGTQVIDHLLRLPLRYFERRSVGELATRINELENIRSFLTGTALTVVLDAVFSIIYIIVMVFYSSLLTLVTLATVPLFAVLTGMVAPIVRQQLRTKAERNAQTQSYLVEVVSGIQTVKAQNIELRSRYSWQERYVRYISASFKSVLTSTTASSTNNFFNKLSSLLLLWVGAYLVLQGKLTLGQLIAFRIIASYTTSPLLRLIQLWQNFQETALSLERLSDILDTPQEGDTGAQNIPMPDIRGFVNYENVDFRFTQSGPLQLNNINLEFAAGTFVGVVGMSGAGKSTLTKLLPRLYELNSGRILIDGYDISKVELYSLRRQIGVVLQDTLLFDGTVWENIALTNPDASSQEVVEAAKIALAHEFIMSLPQGYNTKVGERGAALSGGQRQRIAIARVVLQNPRMLLLDEATNALDYDTERQVCLNLASAFRERTVFFITHRLATIRQADVILMMHQGTVVEQGAHAELMSLKGRYYCLYQQQVAQL